METNEELESNNLDTNKVAVAVPHVIGNLPIAEYDGSPRRYGIRTSENVMPSLLSSPSFTFPRPGFPQVIKCIWKKYAASTFAS